MFTTQVARRLHEEHVGALALLRRLQVLLLRQGPGAPPPVGDPEFAALTRDMGIAIAGEIGNHFRFEEDELFPALTARGEDGLGELLTEEHETIRPVAQRLEALARQPDTAAVNWAEFHRLGNELVERLSAHIEKEETGLVPLIEDLLAGEADARLSEAYALST